MIDRADHRPSEPGASRAAGDGMAPGAPSGPPGPSPLARSSTGDGSGGPEDVHVLYIAGIGRSGSTLLCRALGSVPGFVGAGEVMRVFRRGILHGDDCGCGIPIPRCDLWGGVLDELRRSCPDFDPERVESLRYRVTEGPEMLRYMFLPATLGGVRPELRRFQSLLTILYRAVLAVTGARVIVDSSKNAAYARLLTETRGITLTVVHLIRDARGVTHSLARRRERPGTNGRSEYFALRGPVAGSALWNGAQLMSESLRERVPRFVRVRYEDFVEAPAGTMERILGALGRSNDASALAHVGAGSVRLDGHHLIASNPNRSTHGEILLREDVAWRHEMAAGRRRVVTGLTLPLLLKYGYPVTIGEA